MSAWEDRAVSTSPPRSHSFSLLVPLKRLALAKTRLSPGGDQVLPDRAELMGAFVRDTLEAAAACPVVARVYVVTDEPGLDVDGVAYLPDEGGGELNAALRHAERRVRLRHPDLAVAALCGDLPALGTGDLTEALRSSTAPRWFVADTHGTGTTLLAAGPGVDLDPHFGRDSARRHEESGARALRAAVVTLRHDVDTEADLREAVALGVGRHTRTALRL
jgi:2-phospho-L-lactate guanylyltransferase